ncbi:unnamed protein product [Oreochromis niloticus]|nr:unnamed protein product [Mustela putorius furo]
MATTVGSVAPFDSELQSWEEYCEILDYFFVANDIKEEEKKRAVLLSCVGAQTYALIRNLLSPVKPGDRSYAELVGLLNNHFHPKPSEIVQRWKFNTRNRRPEESVGDYVAELRKLAQDCNFGDSLTVMLRDRLVCGISDDRIQRRLLAEDSLTFEKALKFAQAMEAANRDIVDLKCMTEQSRFAKGLGAVNKMEDGGSTSQQVIRKCYRCGGLNHVAKDCRFVSEKCHNCGKVGHIKRVCRMKMEQKGGRGRQGKQAHFLEEENVESEEEGAEMHHIKASSVTMYNVHEEISIPREEPIRQKLKVNGQNVTFEVDTGCGYTIMSKESFKKLFEGSNAPKVSKCGIKLRTYGGHKVPVWGAAQVQVEFRDSKKKLDVVVVEGAGTSLMGRGWIKALQLDWQPVHKIEGRDDALQRILARHETVFKDELGTLKGFAAKIHVASDAKPCFYKPRSVPFAMKKKVEQELERLLKEEIIQPVKFSEWATPIVPILKPDSSARICGDYKLTVNKVSPVEQYPIPRMEDMIAGLAGGEKYTKLDMSHAYQQVVLDDESRKKFMIITDHKPLISLFHELKAVPQMASQRIMRWAVLLRAYEYVIKYREGKNNSNADGLSRLPLPEKLPKEVAAEDQVLMVDQDQEGVMTSEQLQRWTTKDPILSRVRQQELSVQDGCVLWGARVVIPERGRRPLLEQLHQSHPGMSRMKGLARSYMWWPHMENDIEDKVRSCSTCQEHRHRPQEAPLHPWEWPEKPWRRIHIDYAGPFLGKMFLVIVDAHSKWLDVYPVPSATAAATIDCLRNCFSTHGLPELVVSDNAQCFVSAQTKEFMAKNGITHVTSAPYHPASNGLAERAVQTFKELMKKSTGDTLATKLNRALFSYQITPQSTTGKSPAELMMGRKLRCTLDLIHPDLKQKVTARQDRQRLYHDRHAKERMFVIGDTVYTRNYGRGPKWIPGLIQEMTGPVSYLVMLGNGTVVRRHVDQLFARLEPCLAAGMPEGHPGEPPKAAPNISAETGDTDERHMEVQVTPVVKPHMESSDSQESPATGLRRSQRTKRPPERLRDFVP